jgi:alpha-glucosidase
MMRPFFMEFECDEYCYDEDVNFMLGESLLVAPVVEEGADTKVVYLPDDGGRFYDFYSGEVFEGGCTLEIDVDEKSIPLFVRSGAIIPVAENEIMNLTNDKVTDLTLIMAPDED